ncbi:murein biosynthesis protein MurJ, partial [Streptomyces sp. TRM76130]|nr:murein biosynthesis protein MurJ [Streptomyces sp. TRM76130]
AGLARPAVAAGAATAAGLSAAARCDRPAPALAAGVVAVVGTYLLLGRALGVPGVALPVVPARSLPRLLTRRLRHGCFRFRRSR